MISLIPRIRKYPFTISPYHDSSHSQTCKTHVPSTSICIYIYIYTPLSNKFHQIFAKVNKKVTFTIGFKGNKIKDKLTAAN